MPEKGSLAKRKKKGGGGQRNWWFVFFFSGEYTFYISALILKWLRDISPP